MPHSNGRAAAEDGPAPGPRPAVAAVNDFTLTAATVNGSGSQSANLVLTRSLFAMGIPVAPKNVFPSNIEGLPTWFSVRLSPEGYQARRARCDVLVALNPQTWQGDAAGVAAGGMVVHEATLPRTGPAARDDCTFYPVPFQQLAKQHVADPELRKYLTNMIYVGVIAELLGIEEAALGLALDAQFRRKPKARTSNLMAIELGRAHVRGSLVKQDPFRVERMDGTAGEVLVEGNLASALGCLMGGCTVLAWYPITPSSSLCEHLIALADRYRSVPATGERRIATVQAEDELAAIGMVLGAGWAGARAMTSTSGPGISLMAEFVGFGYFAEVPAVIFDVQRVGPSTGLPTRTMQGDLSFAYTLSHGDTRHPVLLPGSVTECYEHAQLAFDLADRFQTPVFVLSDLDLGMNLWRSRPLAYPDRPFARGKVLSSDDLDRLGGHFDRYADVDGDALPWRTLPGTDHPGAGYFTRGSGHDEHARYTESARSYHDLMARLGRKFETIREQMPAPAVDEAGAGTAVIAYGSSDPAVVEARDILRAEGVATDYLRLRALPVHAEVARFVARHQRTYVVEQNRDGQLYGILRTELPADLVVRLRSICFFEGEPLPADAVADPIRAAEAAVPAAAGAVQ
ncbi:MAG TPA: 2-oxoacid:acceptor oxidoreductase subunit alpha [Verrucomicrobiae bacterium]|nr:2-oxoacid:acceptor oxidoreductase subunit alpha [Verrucomicrobiae bacterium]